MSNNINIMENNNQFEKTVYEKLNEQDFLKKSIENEITTQKDLYSKIVTIEKKL